MASLENGQKTGNIRDPNLQNPVLVGEENDVVGTFTINPDGTYNAVITKPRPTGGLTRYTYENGQTSQVTVAQIPNGLEYPANAIVDSEQIGDVLQYNKKISNPNESVVLSDNTSRIFTEDKKVAIPVLDEWTYADLPTEPPNFAKETPFGGQKDTIEALVHPDSKEIIYRRTNPGGWFGIGRKEDYYSPNSPDAGWSTQGKPTNLNEYAPIVLPNQYATRPISAGASAPSALVQVANAFLQAQSPPSGGGTGTVSAVASLNAACTEYGNTFETSAESVNGYAEAWQIAQVAKASQQADAAKKAAQAVREKVVKKIDESNGALKTGDGKTKKTDEKTKKAKNNAEKTKGHLECAQKTLSKSGDGVIALLNKLVSSKNTSCSNSAKTAKISAEDLEKKASAAFGRTKDTLIKNLKTAENEVKESGNLPKKSKEAATALGNAKTAAEQGATAMENVSDATKQLSKDNSGANSGALSNSLAQATQMGLMMAAMNSFMGKNSDGEELSPAEQPRVQTACQVFNLDTRKDMKAISLDKEGITVAMDPEDHEVYGDNVTQKVGIDFENASLAESEPTYGTVTFSATNHRFSPVERMPASLPIGTLDSCWGADFLADKEPYTQKFHLRFITGDFVQPIPPIDSTTFSCTQGAMVGRTGEGALPAVLLSWKWSDVPTNLCDGKNENYKYCDAVQFAMLVSKRINALQGFLDANPNLPCPTNPFETQLDLDTSPLMEIGGGNPFTASSFVEGCWLPESTELFDGYPSLVYYVNQAGDNVQWTSEIKKLG